MYRHAALTLPQAPAPRRLAALWLLLALGALALSTLCAVLLVLVRLPGLGLESGLGALFGRALVLHVSLAVVVWFLASAAALWTLGAADAGRPAGAVGGPVAEAAHWFAWGLACTGVLAMVASLALGSAQPVLANYVPVLAHPQFLAGLALFVGGVTLNAGLQVPALLRGPVGPAGAGRVGGDAKADAPPPWRLGLLLAAGVLACALAALGLDGWRLGPQTGVERYELLAWAPGHLLQFVHLLLMMSAWMVLAHDLPGMAPLASRRGLAALLLLAAAPVLALPLAYARWGTGSAELRQAFTLLMAWGIWPAALLLALRMLWQLRRAGRPAWQSPLAPVLLLSVLLFLLGCALGAMIRGDTTLVPAHYHGTVGAVTLAYMGLGYRLLAAWRGQAGGVVQRWQPRVYAGGLVLLVLGLAWSGWLGAPRKTASLAAEPAYLAAMGLAGLGGLLAIVGAALFVVHVLRQLGQHSLGLGTGEPAPAQPQRRRDVRPAALVLTLVLVCLLGLLLAWTGADTQGQLASAAAGERLQRQAELDQRFSSGVQSLNRRDYERAAQDFHRVLELAPRLPEAHVNMGFALLGSQRFALARDFFDAAIGLNARQRNAYYGLAEALEGLRDLPGALGAMRSYAHLSPPDDPYLPRANAAIWEWDSALRQTHAGAARPGGTP